MRLKNLDLIGAMLIVVINVVCIWLPDRPLIVGIILGLPLVLVLPGYTLTQALFPMRSLDSTGDLVLRPILKLGQPVSAVDHIILSLGLSLAIDIMMGFALNILPIGLQGRSWAISLGVVIALFALLTAFRRRKALRQIRKILWPHITVYDYILFGLAIIVATGAIWSSILRPPQPQPSFAQFWMLPSSQSSNSCAVQLGLQSHETTSVSYRIVMKVNGTQLKSWPLIVMNPQKEWDQSISLASVIQGSSDIEAQLYRVDMPEQTYQDVHLTMHSLGTSKNGDRKQCTS